MGKRRKDTEDMAVYKPSVEYPARQGVTSLERKTEQDLRELLASGKPFRTLPLASEDDDVSWMMSRSEYRGDIRLSVTRFIDGGVSLVYDVLPEGEKLSNNQAEQIFNYWVDAHDGVSEVTEKQTVPGDSTMFDIFRAVYELDRKAKEVLKAQSDDMAALVSEALDEIAAQKEERMAKWGWLLTGLKVALVVLLCALVLCVFLFRRSIVSFFEKRYPVELDTYCLEQMGYDKLSAQFFAYTLNQIDGDYLLYPACYDGSSNELMDLAGVFVDDTRLASLMDTCTPDDLKLLHRLDTDRSILDSAARLEQVQTVCFSATMPVNPGVEFYTIFPNLARIEVSQWNEDLRASADGTNVYARVTNREDESWALVGVTKAADTLQIGDDVAGVLVQYICPGDKPLTFDVSEDNPRFTTDETGTLLLSKDGETLRCCSAAEGTVVIPEGVKNTDINVFLPTANIEKLVVPSSMETIQTQNSADVVKAFVNPDGTPWAGQFVYNSK